MAGVLSLASGNVMDSFGLSASLLVIAIIIAIGIIFDAIGISVAAASEVPFISMASKKVRGASKALMLIKNADRVSSFCNDVIGDICGIISGTAGAALVVRLTASNITLNHYLVSILISSLIAAFTVGGKALGKTVAIHNSQNIVYYVGYLLSFINLNDKRMSKSKRKRN